MPALHDSAPLEPAADLAADGFRFGDCGTHTSRTIMLAELGDLLAALGTTATRDQYATAIVDENVLGKQTLSTRRQTSQRLAELYGLDPRLPIFRVLRRVWQIDEPGRPLSALLVALARDPLLRSTAPVVLVLPEGAELIRTNLLDVVRGEVGARLNEAVLDKVARNAASSWSQAGHLEGRVRKIRRRVTPTPGSLALALWMGCCEGLAGQALLESHWTRVLDRTGPELLPTALQAKQLGLLHVRAGGGVVEIDASQLDRPLAGGA
ncbi:MAG: hypothetical protein H6722_35495 [Sandaracinus sp.]|nr:hypothetical protein [Sandaracinus sp.]